jgi:tetratricopeptide (TPR) repeat protein
MDEQAKVDGVDDWEGTLEQQRFAFEKEKWHEDFELRRRELELKEVEERRRNGFFGRFDPVSVGLFTAALALVGNFITTTMQNHTKLQTDSLNHTRQLELDHERFEADLIKDYIKTKPEQIEDNLRFLVDSGLVVRKAPQLRIILTSGPKPSLPPGTPLTAGDTEKEACFFGTDWKRSEDACTALLNAHISDHREELKTRVRLGFVFNQLNRYVNAIEILTKAIELDPKYAIAYHNRGFAYRGKGELDLALADFDKTIELDPKYAIAYSNRGSVYGQKGELDLYI